MQKSPIPAPRKELQVVGVDVGTMNFSWCHLHFVDNKVARVDWQKKALLGHYKDSYDKLYDALEKWWQDNNCFEGVDHIDVEKQMSKKMIAVEAWIKGRDMARVRVVNPKTWRNYFGVGTGAYDANKALSIAVMEPMVKDVFPRARKIDDYAESYLIALHGGMKHGFKGEDEYGISERLPSNGARKRKRTGAK
jgi:hypothetical protein